MIATFTHDELNREILVVTTDVEEISRRLAKLSGAERTTDREARRIEGALVATQSWLRERRVMARTA